MLDEPILRQIAQVWIEKVYKESFLRAIVVCLIPSRTDTKYWCMITV